jgi:hypothetical protein
MDHVLHGLALFQSLQAWATLWPASRYSTSSSFATDCTYFGACRSRSRTLPIMEQTVQCRRPTNIRRSQPYLGNRDRQKKL